MRGNLLESVMGAVVLVVAALFLFFAYNTSQLRAVPGYQLIADFERIICAAPSYLSRHGMPNTPADLAKHVCIAMKTTSERSSSTSR